MKYLITFFMVNLSLSKSVHSKPEFGKPFGIWKACYTDFKNNDTEICKDVVPGKKQSIQFEKVSCDVDDGFGGANLPEKTPFYAISLDCSFKDTDMIASVNVSCEYGEKEESMVIITRKSNKARYFLTLKCESPKN